MTTTDETTTDETTTHATPRWHRALGWAAALGTLPYLTLKALWLTGSTVGTTDPAFLADPGIIAANVVTFALDLCVIALAMALTHDWGRRVPAWILLLPAWVGTGFLVPIALLVLPANLLSPAPAGATPFASWLQPMVYGGFAWQGAFLVAAFAVHATARWSRVGIAPAAPSPDLASLRRVVTGGGTVMALASAALHVAVAVAGSADGGAGTAMAAANATLALLGAGGVLALARGTSTRRWSALAAGWVGSATMFSWGLYAALLTMTGSLLGGSDPLSGLAQLTGLLGGFALAVAGLLTLCGAPRPTTSGTPRRPAPEVPLVGPAG